MIEITVDADDGRTVTIDVELHPSADPAAVKRELVRAIAEAIGKHDAVKDITYAR